MTFSNWKKSDGRKAKITFDGIYYSVEVYSDRYNVWTWIMTDCRDRYEAEKWLKENGYKRW